MLTFLTIHLGNIFPKHAVCTVTFPVNISLYEYSIYCYQGELLFVVFPHVLIILKTLQLVNKTSQCCKLFCLLQNENQVGKELHGPCNLHLLALVEVA